MTIETDAKNTNLLHVAARSGDMKTLASLVKQGVNLNALNENGDTPLMVAIIERRLDATRYLVDKGADVNLSDRNGVSTLVHAAIVDHDLQHKKNNDTPFFNAIIHSSHYKYNEKDMHRIEELDLVSVTPTSRERLKNNLQKVAAVAEKFISSTKEMIGTFMHQQKTDIHENKAIISTAPPKVEIKSNENMTTPEPKSVSDETPKPRKP